MRILMISKACVVGSYQRKLEELAKLPGVQLVVVVPPTWREGRNVLRLERSHTAGYDLRVVPMALNGHFHLHFYPTLYGIIKQFQPELVHIDEEPYNLATYQAARLALGHGARYLFFSWQNLLKRYPPPFRWFEDYAYRHASCAIAGIEEAAGALRAKGYTGPLATIPQFGVDPAIYHPREKEPPAKRPATIGYVGRMVDEKGIPLLLEAVAGLGGSWRLSLIGSGPLREALAARVRALDLDSQVTFIDRMPSEAMPVKLRELDILVLPSLTRPNWKEQFGRVLIEAMASEVAVVGSSSGEIPNVIGDAGRVFPEGDALSLRAALDQLIRNPEQRRELARAGRARVLARFTQAQIAARTYEVYRQAMALPNSAEPPAMV